MAVKILLVEDNEMNRDMLSRRLQRRGYEVVTAVDGETGLAMTRREAPALVLMDMSLPGVDGWEATRQLKADPATRAIPIVALTAHAMAGDREQALAAGCQAGPGAAAHPRFRATISALSETASVVRSIELGAEDYLPKPCDPVLLRARIGACLEKKRLRDREAQHAVELAEWNRTLEQRVAEQVGQVERLGRLKRFFSPQLAELIVAGGADDPLRTHRREITVVFCDLRALPPSPRRRSPRR